METGRPGDRGCQVRAHLLSAVEAALRAVRGAHSRPLPPRLLLEGGLSLLLLLAPGFLLKTLLIAMESWIEMKLFIRVGSPLIFGRN